MTPNSPPSASRAPPAQDRRFRIEEHLSHDKPRKPYWRVVEWVATKEDGTRITMEWPPLFASEASAKAAITNLDSGES